MRLPKITKIEEAFELIDEIGILPLMDDKIPGWSLYSVTPADAWWQEGDGDPWDWRRTLSASGKVAYGKLIGGKSTFVKKKLFPILANYRRNGYDFDSLYEEGFAKHTEKQIMDVVGADPIATYEIKRISGVSKGFDGALAGLQAKTYLVATGSARRRNKQGEEYGWHVSLFSTPENWFGEDFVRSRYCDDPKDCFEELAEIFTKTAEIDMDTAKKFIKY